MTEADATAALDVQIYYEDTDHSGVVYHANYLKYFERAREHLLGTDKLVELWDKDGIGFVVYRADLTYKSAAVFGDVVTVTTSAKLESSYRAIFIQRALRKTDGSLLVEGEVHLVCVDRERNLVKLPEIVVSGIRARF